MKKAWLSVRPSVPRRALRKVRPPRQACEVGRGGGSRLSLFWVAAWVVSIAVGVPPPCLAAHAPDVSSGMKEGKGAAGHDDAALISADAHEAMKLLDAQDSYLRQKGFIQLEMLREPATAAVVRRYLESRDPQTRAFSARALAAIEGVKAVPVLVERVNRDRSPRVRIAAILALEPLKDRTATPALIARLRDRSPEVRMAAVDVVSRLEDPDARDAVQLRWRRERNRDVRRVLEEAMKRIGTP